MGKMNKEKECPVFEDIFDADENIFEFGIEN